MYTYEYFLICLYLYCIIFPRFYYQTESLVTFGCMMDFSEFPFDAHVCYFKAHLGLPESEARLRPPIHYQENETHPDLAVAVSGDRGNTAVFGDDGSTGRQFTFKFKELPEEAQIQQDSGHYHENENVRKTIRT